MVEIDPKKSEEKAVGLVVSPGYVLNQIRNYAEQRLALRKFVQEIIKDKTISLDDRWEIFTRASTTALLTHGQWVGHIKALEEDRSFSWYDDFYKDRYATVEWHEIVSDIVDDYEANLEDYESPSDAPKNGTARFYPKLERIKEEILELGEAGFVHDW